ncbi:MAG TPA: hypothetical protein P5079_04710 [Elusimicrobiota bacterium]|nr:hypothetical protein [Elusimicrobiota bacterium]
MLTYAEENISAPSSETEENDRFSGAHVHLGWAARIETATPKRPLEVKPIESGPPASDGRARA